MISTLELRTGLVLFERKNRRLVPTAEAIRLYDEAQRLFTDLSEIGRLAEELKSLQSGGLVIASLGALGRERLPRLLAEFLATRPKVSLSYQVRSSNKVMQWAIAQQVDFGLAMITMEHPAVETETLFSVDAVCVMPLGHPLAARPVITVEDMHAVRFVTFGREGRMRHIIDQLFEARSVQRQLVAESFNSESVCSLVAMGLGVSIVEPFSAANYADRIVSRPFRPVIRYEFNMVTPRFRPRSQLALDLMSFVKKRLCDEAAALNANSPR